MARQQMLTMFRLLIVLVITPSIGGTEGTCHAQIPEKQKSFAAESKPHSYYVQQADAWWKEVLRDSASEENWYNYFRACRNAQGTAHWREDFYTESPSLRPGPEIVRLMQNHIPGTFTCNFVTYAERGLDPSKGEYLLRAFAMNPDFDGIHADVVSYAVSIFDAGLRKRANQAWYDRGDFSLGLLAYGYNVLMSLDSNAILLTASDNDTYPLWMLQDVKGIRTDVQVINIDFLLLGDYGKSVLKGLGVWVSPSVSSSDSRTPANTWTWQSVAESVVANYKGPHPIYIAMTVPRFVYEEFADRLTVSGLTYRCSTGQMDSVALKRYLVHVDESFPDRFRTSGLVHRDSTRRADSVALNRRLVKEILHLDYLDQRGDDPNERRVNSQSRNYLPSLKIVFDDAIAHNDTITAGRMRDYAHLISRLPGNEAMLEEVDRDFTLP